MTVVGQAGHVGHAEDDCGVSRDHTAPLQRLGDDHVVDVACVDPGTLDRGAHRDLGETECVDVDERALPCPSDRGAGGSDDHGVGHG